MAVDRRGFVQGSLALSAVGVGAPGHSAPAPGHVPGPNADRMFAEPFIDVEEWREEPFRHLYIHGGFKDTDARFVMYLPPKEKYQGRFFQPVPPVPTPEDVTAKMYGGTLGADRITGLDTHRVVRFAFDSGAALIASNLGGFSATPRPHSDIDPTVAGYRASAATARYARIVAGRIYGPHRTYGYCFGGSGGGYHSISNLQNSDAYDGGVPFMHPCPLALPNAFAVRLRALRVLKDKLPQIADALEPGGGDPFAGLNAEEHEVLTEVTRFGFPLRTWVFHDEMGLGAFPILYQAILETDPGYFSDFWTKPGYLGKDHPERFDGIRIQHRVRVRRVIMSDEAATAGLRIPGRMAIGSAEDPPAAWRQLQKDYGGTRLPVAIELDGAPPTGDLTGANIKISSGRSAGRQIVLGGISGNRALFQFGPNSGSLRDISEALRAGDEVTLDNSDKFAFETYYRHTLLGPDSYVCNQFRRADGTPMYPQREKLPFDHWVRNSMGTLITGGYHGKMIVLQYMLDWDAHPWFADWYRSRVREQLGEEFSARYRLYFVDHCTHGQAPDPSRTVPYLGALEQALRDLAAWVERGAPPLPDTVYKVAEGQVLVPETASARRGIQPTVAVQANGGPVARVKAGEPVTLNAVAECPPGVGRIVSAEWDFVAGRAIEPEHEGRFTVSEAVTPAKRIALTRTHVFAKPGTYFPALRVHSARRVDAETPYARVPNLGRVRVIVT